MTATAKKVFSIITKILTVFIIIFTLLIVLFTILASLTVGKNDKTIFGHSAYIVLSDSMQDTFAAGDIVVSKVNGDFTNLADGTIITFLSEDPGSFGATITHKIRCKTEVDGKVSYITYGTTTGEDDKTAVRPENIIGIYSFRLPKMGYFFQFLKTPWGYVTIILVPFLLLIGFNCAHFIKLYKGYKKQKNQEALDTISAEREETERLKEELELLKAQLNEQKKDE